MSSTWSSSRWPSAAASSMLLLLLASKRMTTVYSKTFTVSDEDQFQEAFSDVMPGDTIEIESGEYYVDMKTEVDGTADERITIRGAGGSSNREDVVIRGGGEGRVFQIQHDYYTIEGFTIDGRNLRVEEVDDDNYREAYRDILVYATNERDPKEMEGGYLSSLDGLIIRDMAIKNAGGECIRLRYFVTNAEIHNNIIEDCGVHDFVYVMDDKNKNGEGIYIGTSINQWDDGKNPTDDPDVCSRNTIYDNMIKTNGNEGVDVKEGSVDNIIEGNQVYMQLDTKSGGISTRGDRTIIRNNYITDASGAGVRVGGGIGEDDGQQYGVDNEVYGNTMVNCKEYGVKVEASPQAQICGNDIQLPNGNDDDDDYAYTGGDYGDDYDSREDCDDRTEPPIASPMPSTTPPIPPTTPPMPSTTPPMPSTTPPIPSTTPPTSSTTPPTPSTMPPTPSTMPPTPSTTTPAPSTTPPLQSPTPLTFAPTFVMAPTTSPTPSPTLPTFPPRTSPPTAYSGDVEYVGCFADFRGSRTMSFGYRSTDHMTNKSCIEYCRYEGESYAGTTKGNVCRCASSSYSISRNGESDDCDNACTGDDSEECGGRQAVSTWEI